MAYLPYHPDSVSLKRPLVWSAVFHALIFSSLLVSTLVSHRGDMWGSSGGGAVSVGLVARLPGITLPRPESVTTSQVVDTSKGLYKSLPEPKAEEVAPDVKPIPQFKKEKAPHYITRPSKVLEDKTPPPPNAIPYGQGGSPALPYSSFAMNGPSQGGMQFSGPSGGGDFAGKFPTYVQAVANRISSNWLQSTVDPSVRWAPRAMFTFQIFRDGSVANVQMTQSSGIRSVDNSALRAILASTPMSALPSNYSGSSVNVEFYFDFRR